MKINQLLKSKGPVFSFEFFPPKSDEDAAQLLRTAQELRGLEPGYISVTWGAGGSTRRKTIDLVCAIKERLNVETMAHLTCVGASRGDLDLVLNELRDRGVENVLALRGDPPRGQADFVPHPDGFKHASELVAHIRQGWSFCLGGACYPEGHVECPDKEKDLDHLKIKVDAGVEFLITQLFFDNADYFRFRDQCLAAGIRVPIIPGIMPITNVNQIKRFTTMCGARIPASLLGRLEAAQEDAEAVVRLGVEHAAAQCRDLLAGQAPGIHFYTLNRSRSTLEIFKTIR